MSTITIGTIVTIFSAFLFLVLVVPPLAIATVNVYPTFENAGNQMAKTIPKTIEQLCIADEKISDIKKNLDAQILETIPATTPEQIKAKWNLMKIYNGLSLTMEEIQTLKNIPKYYKYKIGLNDIEKELSEHPEMLCGLLFNSQK